MGYIKVKASFYNAIDYVKWFKGELSEANVRRVDVEALVDTGATYPALPEDLVEKLGLTLLREVDGETAGGVSKLKLHGLVIVEIEDRIAECPVILRPRGTTPLIGVVALEQMGFKVDPVTGKLVKGLPLML
jgi:clan AA aspartic protease